MQRKVFNASDVRKAQVEFQGRALSLAGGSCRGSKIATAVLRKLLCCLDVVGDHNGILS